MMKFRSSLETHKTALGLALDMVAITITRDIKDDTQEIRKDTAAIKDDTVLILEQIAQLQAQLPQNIIKDTSNHMLHRYLDDLSNFAELMSNPPEDEPEALTAVNSEDEDKSASSPPSIHRNFDTSDRRPSSLLSEMYTEAYCTSTSRKSVQHIHGVPSPSPTPGNALNPTGASGTGTPDQPLTAQQDGPSQSDPRPDRVENPPKVPEARPTVQNDDLPRLPQSHSIPPIKHQIQKPNPVVRSLHPQWEKYPRTTPTKYNIPGMRPFSAVSIAPWALEPYQVPDSKAQPSTSSAAAPNTPSTETSAPKAKDNIRRNKGKDHRGPNTSRKTPAKLATKPPSKSASAAKLGILKGSSLRSKSPGNKDRQSPVPAPALGNRVRVARTGGAASWGFWGHTSKKASI